MRLRFEQLSTHLKHNLAPVYLIYGDEILLLQEAAASIRAAARAQGYGERMCLTVEPGFAWEQLLEIAANRSLFAERRLLELRLGDSKPGDAGSKVLQTYAKRPPEDMLLLLTCGKLDGAAQNSRWLRALDAAGVTLPIWPVSAVELPNWIARRLQAKGLQPNAEASAVLAERVEGNLLAAAQEIDKLAVLCGQGAVSAEQILALVSDSARYSVYDLVDAALAKQAERVVRIVNGLRTEGVEAVLVAWALHREIRLLAKSAYAVERGEALAAVLSRQGVWEKRKPLLQRALQRLSSGECRSLLRHCNRIDYTIKGIEQGEPWDELLKLSLTLAGQPLLANLELDQMAGNEYG